MKPANLSPETFKALQEFSRKMYPEDLMKPEQSSDSELLTPSEIESMRQDFRDSKALLRKLD